MECANPVVMPLDPNVQLDANPDRNKRNRSNSYAKLLGKLQFLVNVTCPNIVYVVNRLVEYTANLSLQHSTTLKRILHYLAGTREYGITYHKDFGANMNIFYGYLEPIQHKFGLRYCCAQSLSHDL